MSALAALQVVILGDHDRSAFTYGQLTLDRYLREQAGQDRRRHLAQTYVLVDPAIPRHILGYYSLATQSIDVSALPPGTARRIPYPAVPCLLIGRLAVDHTHQGQGLGAFLLDRALRHCLALSAQVGAHAVLVDAIDESAARFYARHDFVPLHDDPGRRLYLAMAAIAKAIPGTGQP